MTTKTSSFEIISTDLLNRVSYSVARGNSQDALAYSKALLALNQLRKEGFAFPESGASDVEVGLLLRGNDVVQVMEAMSLDVPGELSPSDCPICGLAGKQVGHEQYLCSAETSGTKASWWKVAHKSDRPVSWSSHASLPSERAPMGMVMVETSPCLTGLDE